MKRIVLTFGLISGAILAAMMVATIPFVDQIGFDRSMIIGYTTMVLAFLLVFFGIRSYRETIGKGQISFLRALGVGLLIVTVATLCYVVTWEIIYHNFFPDFGDKYLAYGIEQVRTSGKSPQEIENEIEYMRRMMGLYNSSVLFSAAVTFLEPLPVGLPVSFISALILRKRRREQQDLQDVHNAVKETSVNPV
ncbi:MAG TPA: DUF4199 domain-containing protein [Pyrinomonadaceae bacterium]|nr:DUF4199 domain-containing protein [Pyrinomonadaceae bacterium]